MHRRPPFIDARAAAERDAAADEITCRQFVELVTDYCERALGVSTLDRVEEHLVMCDWCVTYLGQYQTTVGLLGDLRAGTPADEPPAGLLAAVRARRDPSS